MRASTLGVSPSRSPHLPTPALSARRAKPSQSAWCNPLPSSPSRCHLQRVRGSPWDEEGRAPWGTLGLGKDAKLFSLLAFSAIEFVATGGLLWAPLCFSILSVITTPSSQETERKKERAVRIAVDQARLEMMYRMPSTLPESVGWLNQLMSAFWKPYFLPMVMTDNMGQWQEKVSSASPSGWTLELAGMTLGSNTPQLSNVQAFNNTSTGALNYLNCDMSFVSDTMQVSIKGIGPVGEVTATMSNLSVQDRVLKLLPDIDEAYTVAASSGGEGELRFTPLCQQLGGVCARLAVLTFRLLAGSQTLANPKSFEQFLVKHADQPRSSSDAGQLLEVQSKSYHQVTEAALCRRLAAAELPTNWSEEVRDFIHSALDASCTVASLLASPWVRIHSSLSPEGNYEGATAAMPLYTALSVVEDISGDEETVDRSLGDLSLVDSSLGVNGGVVAKPMFTGLEVPADNNSDDFQTCSVNLGCSVGPSYVDSESIIKGLGGVPDASAPDYAMYL
eukprot:gene15380-21466_t